MRIQSRTLSPRCRRFLKLNRCATLCACVVCVCVCMYVVCVCVYVCVCVLIRPRKALLIKVGRGTESCFLGVSVFGSFSLLSLLAGCRALLAVASMSGPGSRAVTFVRLGVVPLLLDPSLVRERADRGVSSATTVAGAADCLLLLRRVAYFCGDWPPFSEDVNAGDDDGPTSKVGSLLGGC
jgi:hypothetical protein